MKTGGAPTSKQREPAEDRTRVLNRAPGAVAVSATPKAADEPGRGGIQSLERAFAILEQVALHRDGMALVELCKRVGLHTSTAFHLVRTMVRLGYASQDARTKKYKIGGRVFSLAAGALDENEMANRVVPVLERLTARTGESSHFAVLSANDIVILARTGGSGMFQLVDRAGAVRPPNATALGKVLLSALTPAQLERYLEKREFVRFTPKTIVEHDAFIAELEQVRRNGIAFDDGEYDAEVRCVAVPVYDFLGRVAGAIGISGPMWRLSLQSLHEKSKLVRQSATEFSAELGFRGGQEAPLP